MAITSLQSSAKAAAAVIVERSHHVERRRIEQRPAGAEGKAPRRGADARVADAAKATQA